MTGHGVQKVLEESALKVFGSETLGVDSEPTVHLDSKALET
jgi:hypothetical protein